MVGDAAETARRQPPILVYWTLFASGRAPLVCELCRTSTGLELRCGDGSDIRREPVRDAAEGWGTARAWKALYVADPGYSEYAWEPRAAAADDRPTTVLERRARHQHGGDLRRRSCGE